MTHPDVDALIPTVARPELLRAAVDSVVAQDYAGVIRITVHYDGEDPDIDASLVSDDPRRPVRIIGARPGKRGASASRNTMILATSSPIVALLDDDDTWRQDKVRRQVDLLAAQEATEVVMSGSLVVGHDTEVERIPEMDQITLHDFIRSRVNAAHTSSLMVRRDALEEIGLLDEEIPGSYAEDRDWMIRAARRAPVAVIREPLVRVIAQDQSLFAGRWDTIIAAMDYLVAKHPEFADDDVAMARMVGRRAFALASLGRFAEARTTARDALRLSPRDRRAWVALAVGMRVVPSSLLLRAANLAGRGI